MKRLLAALAATFLLVSPVSASTNFSQALVDAAHPLQVFVHQGTAGPLGAKVTWQGAACCANGHLAGLTLTISLVDQPTAAYVEIDNNGESCSVGGGKPISCYVLAPAFTKGGSAPVGWYIVKVEQFNATETETGVKLAVDGNIDQTAPGP